MDEINPENIKDMIDLVSQNHRESLYDDPEFTTNKYFHIKLLIEAISVGIIAADPYHKNYYLPKNFEKVMNYFVSKIQERFTDEVIHCCLIKIEGISRKILFSCPEFLEWNTIGSPDDINIVTRYDDLPNEKQFMDLDAMLRNAINHLKNTIRKHEEFDKKFEENWKLNHPE